MAQITKLLEYFDSAAMYFLYSLMLIGGGASNGVTFHMFAKENLPRSVIWLTRWIFGLVIILTTFACWFLITQ